MLFFRLIHSSLHRGVFLVFCLFFFLKGKHFVMLHKLFFVQIKKQEKMTLYLTGSTLLSGSLLCCSFMHYLFRKLFCNILIQKFQIYSPQTGCLALILEQLLVQKILYFLFLQPETNTYFPDYFLIAT